MFSSLASFIFGSITTGTSNSETNQNLNNQQDQVDQPNRNLLIEEPENTIELTSSTPSIAGTNSLITGSVYPASKRSHKKRNRTFHKNKRQSLTSGGAGAGAGQNKPTSSITKLLTPNDSVDEDFDEGDWYIVEREDEGEDDSLPRTDSEEEVSVVEIKPKLTAPLNAVGQQQGRRRHYHNNSHSLYSGPRPQQQRNYLQRTRNNGSRGPLSASTLSTNRKIGNLVPITPPSGLSDGGMSQSLYVAPNPQAQPQPQSPAQAQQSQQHNANLCDILNGANPSLEESWFVTPPSCFTCAGPVNMETSPYENLLIEHPSMSVYYSIRSAQEATESLFNLNLGMNESLQRKPVATTAVAKAPSTPKQSVQQRSSGGARIDRQSAAQLKQELLARDIQKCREKKERQKLCATALKRSNAAREHQSKGNRPRRSDLQHYRVNSGANNNRNNNNNIKRKPTS